MKEEEEEEVCWSSSSPSGSDSVFTTAVMFLSSSLPVPVKLSGRTEQQYSLSPTHAELGGWFITSIFNGEIKRIYYLWTYQFEWVSRTSDPGKNGPVSLSFTASVRRTAPEQMSHVMLVLRTEDTGPPSSPPLFSPLLLLPPVISNLHPRQFPCEGTVIVFFRYSDAVAVTKHQEWEGGPQRGVPQWEWCTLTITSTHHTLLSPPTLNLKNLKILTRKEIQDKRKKRWKDDVYAVTHSKAN